MKKIVFGVLLLLILTGCDVQYDLVVKNKKKITETITVSVDNQVIENNSMTIDEYLDYYSSLYENNPGYAGINIDTKKGDTYSSFIAKNEYSSLDDYITSYIDIYQIICYNNIRYISSNICNNHLILN